MSDTIQTAQDQTPAAESLYTREETIAAARVLIGVAFLVVVTLVAVLLWGLPALTMIALAMAVAVMVLLVAYAAGF